MIIGGLNNENSDRDNKGVDFRFKNGLEIGNKNGLIKENLDRNGSDDGIIKYIVDNIEEIKKSVNDLTEEKDVETKKSLMEKSNLGKNRL